MTNATHTPGPWEVSQWSPPYDHIGGDYSVGYTDADGVYWDIATLEPSRASRLTDAHLIAAAPDMLAALEALLEGTCEAMSFLDTHLVEHLKPLADAAERAIAKAKGE